MLVITKSEIDAIVPPPAELMEAMREAFVAYSSSKA